MGDRVRKASLSAKPFSPRVSSRRTSVGVSPQLDHLADNAIRRKVSTVAKKGSDSEDNGKYSHKSVLSAMDRFVQSVGDMESTVLIPSKLIDIELQTGPNAPPVPNTLIDADLYSFYKMINEVKKEFIFGPESERPGYSEATPPSDNFNMGYTRLKSGSSGVADSNSLQSWGILQRIPSGESLSCYGSGTDTDSEPEPPTDRTSSRQNKVTSDSLAFELKGHLRGLHVILHQLSDSAEYLSKRYQQDVEGEEPTINATF